MNLTIFDALLREIKGRTAYLGVSICLSNSFFQLTTWLRFLLWPIDAVVRVTSLILPIAWLSRLSLLFLEENPPIWFFIVIFFLLDWLNVKYGLQDLIFFLRVGFYDFPLSSFSLYFLFNHFLSKRCRVLIFVQGLRLYWLTC